MLNPGEQGSKLSAALDEGRNQFQCCLLGHQSLCAIQGAGTRRGNRVISEILRVVLPTQVF